LAIAILICCAVVIFFAFFPKATDKVAEKIDELPKKEATQESVPDEIYAPVIGISSGNNLGIDVNQILDPNKAVYEQPKESQVIPEGVTGRTDYEEIKEEAKQIEETEAELLEKELGLGEKGEDLVLSEEFYPYYAMLTESMQQLYRQILANANDLQVSFAPVVPVTVNQLKNVFEALYNDHPELFWLDTNYSCKYVSNGVCVEISLRYNETASYLEDAKKNLERVVSDILNDTRKCTTDLEKEKVVHDALMEQVEYVKGAPMNQSAYSALVLGKSVCAGYARAFQYLMQRLNIPCYYCIGYSGGNHAWNIVKIGKEYANVDVTWADTNPPTYDYYNKSDKDYQKTHVRRDLAVYLPACGGLTGNSDPLTWEEEKPVNNTELSEKEKRLQEAGIAADEVVDNLEDYYGDCYAQLIEKGAGSVRFSNVIPEELWDSIETIYSNNAYKDGYVTKALEKLGMDQFSIHLQGQRLGGGYYRLYHNVSTYKDTTKQDTTEQTSSVASSDDDKKTY